MPILCKLLATIIVIISPLFALNVAIIDDENLDMIEKGASRYCVNFNKSPYLSCFAKQILINKKSYVFLSGLTLSENTNESGEKKAYRLIFNNACQKFNTEWLLICLHNNDNSTIKTINRLGFEEKTFDIPTNLLEKYPMEKSKFFESEFRILTPHFSKNIENNDK